MSSGAQKRECIRLAVSKLRSLPWMFDSQNHPAKWILLALGSFLKRLELPSMSLLE
jgi:hypothetical protein